jgi:hypothetical protein
MPCGPLKQYNKFQLAYRYRTVSTLASYSFPVFLPYAKHNTEHICVSQHSVVTLCLSTRYILQSKIFRFSYAVPIGSLLAPHNDRPTLYHCPFLLLAQFSLSLSLSHSLPLLPTTPTTNYTASHSIPQRGQLRSHFNENLKFHTQFSAFTQDAGRTVQHLDRLWGPHRLLLLNLLAPELFS